MSARWDLTVYDQHNQLVLVVEVKSKLDATPEWAARLRRNIFSHGVFPNAPYFLMVFPDRFYLWKNSHPNHEPIAPTYVIDARPILKPYFEQAGLISGQVGEQSLELIIASWLSELIHKPFEELDNSQYWLVGSGLYDAVAGGFLEHEVFV